MRFFALALAAALLLAGAARADNNTIKDNAVFGFALCGPNFSCTTGVKPPSTVIQRANACVHEHFNMTSPEGYFEEIMGLDANDCLTSKSLPKASIGLTMTPLCCVVPVSGDECQIKCTRYGVQ